MQSFGFAIALRVSSQLRSATERCCSECGFASKRSLKIPTNAKADLAIKIQAVANAFNRSPKTIRKWFNEGCNIFDPHEVMQWSQVKAKNSMSRNSHTAESMDMALNGHRRDTAGMLNLEILDRLPPAVGEGAAAALKRLQGLEAIFYSRQLEALARGRTDLITFALNDYNKVTETLRRYEKEVETAMRDSGQLISRGEAERGAESVARWFRLGWRLWLSSSVPDLLALAGDPLAFKAKAEETFVEIMSTVFLKAREAKIAVPEWAWKAIREEFRANISTEA